MYTEVYHKVEGRQLMSTHVCIGIDQSYKRTGVSVSVDGALKLAKSIDLSRLKSKSEKRAAVSSRLSSLLSYILARHSAGEVVCVLERVRTFSQKFLSVPYIKSMGALNAAIADLMWQNGITCYSVDTRAWKSGVVGYSSPADTKHPEALRFSRRFNMDPRKAPTALLICKNYPVLFRREAVRPVASRRQKGTFISKSGVRCEIDDDLCDSVCISLSWTKLDPSKFIVEE